MLQKYAIEEISSICNIGLLCMLTNFPKTCAVTLSTIISVSSTYVDRKVHVGFIFIYHLSVCLSIHVSVYVYDYNLFYSPTVGNWVSIYVGKYVFIWNKVHVAIKRVLLVVGSLLQQCRFLGWNLRH